MTRLKKLDFKIRVNPELNKYNHQVLFPEAVKKAEAFLAQAGLPTIVIPHGT